MDRLDAWLNAQRGWRRRALIVAGFYPSTVLLAFSVWLCFDLLPGPAGGPALPALAVSAIAVLGLPVSVGLGSVTAVIHRRQALNPPRRKGRPPFFMWRLIAALWLMLLTYLSATLSAAQGPPPTTGHRVLAGLQFILAIALTLLSLETIRYSRRFTKPPATDQPDRMPSGQAY